MKGLRMAKREESTCKFKLAGWLDTFRFGMGLPKMG